MKLLGVVLVGVGFVVGSCMASTGSDTPEPHVIVKHDTRTVTITHNSLSPECQDAMKYTQIAFADDRQYDRTIGKLSETLDDAAISTVMKDIHKLTKLIVKVNAIRTESDNVLADRTSAQQSISRIWQKCEATLD